MRSLCQIYNSNTGELVEKTLHDSEKEALDYSKEKGLELKKKGIITTANICDYTEEMAWDDFFLYCYLLSNNIKR